MSNVKNPPVSRFNLRFSDSVVISYMETVDDVSRFTHWRVAIGKTAHDVNSVDDVISLLDEDGWNVDYAENELSEMLTELVRVERVRILDESISEVQ
jgi:hypothetical protein|tara:strand:- start:163 stop:453 length:291 start_codon:yes stop_codon:yes gene_type:complete